MQPDVSATKLPIYKFTQLAFAEDFIRGHIRVAPASSYNDPSLELAVRDNELEVTAVTDKSTTKVYKVDQNTLEVEREIPTIVDITFALESVVDYYVLCFTGIFTKRLYSDFKANACVVISDYERFVKRVFNEFEGYAGKWSGQADFVTYYDPRQLQTMPNSVFFQKEIRYGYQNEYRIVIRPPKNFTKFEPFFVEIGDISSYCEILTPLNGG